MAGEEPAEEGSSEADRFSIPWRSINKDLIKKDIYNRLSTTDIAQSPSPGDSAIMVAISAISVFFSFFFFSFSIFSSAQRLRQRDCKTILSDTVSGFKHMNRVTNNKLTNPYEGCTEELIGGRT